MSDGQCRTCGVAAPAADGSFATDPLLDAAVAGTDDAEAGAFNGKSPLVAAAPVPRSSDALTAPKINSVPKPTAPAATRRRDASREAESVLEWPSSPWSNP
jgi:hypothetical protein